MQAPSEQSFMDDTMWAYMLTIGLFIVLIVIPLLVFIVWPCTKELRRIVREKNNETNQ